MKTELAIALYVAFLMVSGAAGERELGSNSTRSEKFLSLFSVVRFSNSFCFGSNGYNGTCLTSAECSNNGGTSAGSCASGFGVCCTVIKSTCGATVTLNNTYWQNSGYTTATTTAGQCSLYVQKSSSDICQIRLDFINFVIANPDAAAAMACTTCSQCLTDIFTVSGQSNIVPPMCGTMTNQHIYMSLNPGTTSISLNLLLTGTATSRTWNVLIRQIPCGTTYTAPDHCLQWFTDATGSFSSFNYLFSATPLVQHLANQDYTICIRTNQGFCGICYQTCDTSAPAASAFVLSSEATTTIIDGACLTDFIQIPCATDQQSSSQVLSLATATGCTSKICGTAFTAVTGLAAPAPVYSYRKPFEVRFYTNSFDAKTDESIGFCLKYTQQPCGSN